MNINSNCGMHVDDSHHNIFELMHCHHNEN